MSFMKIQMKRLRARGEISPEGILLTIFIIIIVATIFEIILLAIAFLSADEIECNLIWCSFKTERRTIQQSMNCYINDIQVNCSDFNNRFPDYARHGWRSVNGICPGWNDNRTFKDCMEAKEQ